VASDILTVRNRINALLWIFLGGLVLSGLTAFPIKAEADILQRLIGVASPFESLWPEMSRWISFVHAGVTEMSQKYPFLSYGTDWLAFAHIIIAIAFIGPLRDPVKNVWVVQFGMIACVLVVPTALICGQIRGIPFYWRLIDCSFGVIGIIPLWLSRRYIQRLIQLQSSQGKDRVLD
jgi:hypothetical protein